MALVPTIETLLFEIRKSFGLNDKKTSKDKYKFLKIDQNLKNHGELYEQLKVDLYKQLSIKESDRSALDTQFYSAACLQVKLNQGLFSRGLSAPQIAWLLASHVFIPAIAKVLAIWQRDKKMDVGMPSNTYWYLPKVEKGQLTLPVAQVLDWLNSLMSVSGTDDFLIDQVYGSDNKNGKSRRLNIDKASLKKNMRNWRTKVSPAKTTQNLHYWFDDEVQFIYENTFEIKKEESFEMSMVRAREYICNNEFSLDDLCKEFQSFSRVDIEKILVDIEESVVSRAFLNEMYQRYSAPSNYTIRLRLHFAVAAQDMYMRFGKLLHGDSFKAHSIDYDENILNQLIELFNVIYNNTYLVEMTLNPQNIEHPNIYGKCDYTLAKILEDTLPAVLVGSINKPKGEKAIFQTIEWLNHLLLTDSSETGFLQIFQKDTRGAGIHPEYKDKYEEYAMHYEAYMEVASRQGSIKDCPSAYSLMLVGRDESLSFEIRKDALDKLSSVKYEDPIMWTYFIETELIFVDSLFEKMDSALGYAEYLLEAAYAVPCHDANKPFYLYIEARVNMFKRQYKEATRLFKKANEASKVLNSGRMRGITARYVFMIDASTRPNGYNLGNYERWYRDMCMFGGFPSLNRGATPPVDHALHWHFSELRMKLFPDVHPPVITPRIKETEVMLIERFKLITQTKVAS
jgi:hypothetical protein